MPPTATLEAIKAYQDQVEKDNITPHNLPACPRCRVDSSFFKIHAYRERRLLIIIPHHKYKTHQRKKLLINCQQLIIVEAFFQATFKTSIFTKLAICHAFG
jgi:hypothetical protein